MAVPDTRTNIQNTHVTAFYPVAGTPTGAANVSILSPVRGRIIEVGFSPCSLVASAMTMACAVGNQISSQASNFTQFVTSTLGTFASQVLYEGAPCSVIPAANTFVNAGDAIQFSFSGGNTSAIGATFYAIIRRG